MQYEWAGGHIKSGIRSLTLDKVDRDDISRWLEATAAAGKLLKRSLQICRRLVLYGLRRSELLALRWGGLDLNKGTMRISGGLVEARGKPIWTEGKNERSRRTILLDSATLRALKTHRALQLQERLAAGTDWVDVDRIISTNTGCQRAIEYRQATSTKPSAD